MLEFLEILKRDWLALLIIFVAVLWALTIYANFRIEWSKTTPDKSDDEAAKVFKLRVDIFVKWVKKLFTGFADFLASFKPKKKDDKGFVGQGLLQLLGAAGFGILIGLLISNFLIPAKVEVVKDESMKIEYEALKAEFAEQTKEVQKLKSEQVKKSRIVTKYADGSSKEEEHSDSISLEQSYEMSKDEIANLQIKNEYLMRQIKETRTESKSVGSVRALADFSKENKYEGYRVGGTFKYLAADAVMRDNKYAGYSVGLGFNF